MGIVINILLHIILLLNLVASQKKLTLVKSHVQFNTAYIENNTVDITKNGTSIDVIVNIKRNYPRDLWATVNVAKRDLKSKNYVPIFTYDLNVCRFMGRKNHHDNANLMQLWFEKYWKYGNMPRYCPIMKGHYFWKGVRVDRSMLPPFVQAGGYCTSVKAYFKEDPQLQAPYVSLGNVSVYSILR